MGKRQASGFSNPLTAWFGPRTAQAEGPERGRGRTGGKRLSGKPGGRKLGRRALLAGLISVATLAIVLAIWISVPPVQVNRPPPTEIPPPTTGAGSATGPKPSGSTDPTQPTEPPLVRKEDFYTFLLLGTHDDYNTDTIMLASLDLQDPDHPKAEIISIPRDSQINTSWNLKKINSVYGVNKGGEAGALAVCEWIEKITGVYPDFYATVNIRAFTRIVDVVGGVPFYIPYDMLHTKPDSDPTQQYYIDMPKGQYTLDAEQALNVVRYRGTGRADWGRMDIQKSFLIALMKRVKSTFSLDKIPGLAQTVVGSVKTNMPANNMVWFYNMGASKMDLDESITLHSLPDLGAGKYQGQDYVFLDGPGIVELVNRTVNPYTRGITEGMLDIIRLED